MRFWLRVELLQHSINNLHDEDTMNFKFLALAIITSTSLSAVAHSKQIARGKSSLTYQRVQMARDFLLWRFFLLSPNRILM